MTFVIQPSLTSTFFAACSVAPFSSRARFWPEVAGSSVLLMTGMPLANGLASFQLTLDEDSNLPSIFLNSRSIFTETSLLVLVAAFSPVATVIIATTAPTTTSATSAATASTAMVTTVAVACLYLAGLDILNLFVAVVFLALDDQIFAVPFRGGIQSEELLLSLLCIKLNKDTSLEGLIESATQTDCLCGSERSKESFNLKLCLGTFFAESLDINAAAHSLVLKHLDDIWVEEVIYRFGQRNFALDFGIVINKVEDGGSLHGLNNGAEGLEAAHSLEAVEERKLNGMVGTSADLLEEEVVHGEVGVREIKFNLLELMSRSQSQLKPCATNLFPNLIVVIGHLLSSEIRLDILAVVASGAV